MRSSVVPTALVLLLASAHLATAAPPKRGNRAANKALLEAILADDPGAVQAALKAGADPNAKDAEGTPALVAAFRAPGVVIHRTETVRALLAAKASVRAAGKDGVAALAAAVRTTGAWDLVDELIKAGADVDAVDTDGWTPLHYAAFVGNGTAADKLIEAKAKVDVPDKEGWTALYLALNEGHSGVAQKLVKAGAPPTAPKGKFPIVLAAAASRDPGSVRVALDLGGDVNAAVPDTGITPLMLAAVNDYGVMLMDLLRAGADPALKDAQSRTALDLATAVQSREAVALLGGPWEKPALAKPALQVDCPVLGGKVATHVGVEGEDVVVRTVYPKPFSYYLGGGLVNRADSAKAFTYEGTVAPSYYFDTDNSTKTGFPAETFEKSKQGAELALTYSEYITSVQVGWVDPEGQQQQKQVSQDVLSPSVESVKGDIEGYYPRAENEVGVLKTTVPLSAFGVKPGRSVKLSATIGQCGPVTASVKLK